MTTALLIEQLSGPVDGRSARGQYEAGIGLRRDSAHRDVSLQVVPVAIPGILKSGWDWMAVPRAPSGPADGAQAPSVIAATGTANLIASLDRISAVIEDFRLPGGGEQGVGLVAVQPGGVGFVVQAGPADMDGR